MPLSFRGKFYDCWYKILAPMVMTGGISCRSVHVTPRNRTVPKQYRSIGTPSAFLQRGEAGPSETKTNGAYFMWNAKNSFLPYGWWQHIPTVIAVSVHGQPFPVASVVYRKQSCMERHLGIVMNHICCNPAKFPSYFLWFWKEEMWRKALHTIIKIWDR